MSEIIVIGRRFTGGLRTTENIYTGNDGVAAHEAAEAAADRGLYYFIGRITNPSHLTPCRVAPHPGKPGSPAQIIPPGGSASEPVETPATESDPDEESAAAAPSADGQPKPKKVKKTKTV